ncbi:DUF2493 domain-containing protein [Roseivirga spongicola]|uniref:YspA cpYpsA-related SLOG domain-containing protein n=1 Tax=Roseivirga spongicola TaxID=333140 RepID=A0A150XDZ6_9BACT|nr:DUF2493 domain-containing protein [Roseivirga spongicola]KYG76922.1 hypothetical protein AWW68_18875 [Roseivirga spongicola]WPZ08800.1 DUF2493 domain-containing protein [Roseivirga spongicola]
MTFKVIIAGGRTFNDYEMLKAVCKAALQHKKDIEVVSGTANGADKLGERYAKENGLKLTQFPADWNRYGKSAGYKRNREMALYADALIAFWDGKSKGTKHMIDLAKKSALQIRVKHY